MILQFFKYWCAFQLVALNLGIWKPKYLLHGVRKAIHKGYSNYELDWLGYECNNPRHFDVDAFIMDTESRILIGECSVPTRTYIKDYYQSIYTGWRQSKFSVEYVAHNSFKFRQLIAVSKAMHRLDEIGIK